MKFGQFEFWVSIELIPRTVASKKGFSNVMKILSGGISSPLCGLYHSIGPSALRALPLGVHRQNVMALMALFLFLLSSAVLTFLPERRQVEF